LRKAAKDRIASHALLRGRLRSKTGQWLEPSRLDERNRVGTRGSPVPNRLLRRTRCLTAMFNCGRLPGRTCRLRRPAFLSQLVTLLRKRTHSAAGRYVYSQQEYLLALERRQPSGDRERLLTVRGQIRNLRTGRETSFRLWLEDDSAIVPVRFEFQPRSFLRLSFEAERIRIRAERAGTELAKRVLEPEDIA
jgi:hypothetical protein